MALLSTPMFMNTGGNQEVSGQTVQTLQPVPVAADWAQDHFHEPKPTSTPNPYQAGNVQEQPVPVRVPTPPIIK